MSLINYRTTTVFHHTNSNSNTSTTIINLSENREKILGFIYIENGGPPRISASDVTPWGVE